MSPRRFVTTGPLLFLIGTNLVEFGSAGAVTYQETNIEVSNKKITQFSSFYTILCLTGRVGYIVTLAAAISASFPNSE